MNKTIEAVSILFCGAMLFFVPLGCSRSSNDSLEGLSPPSASELPVGETLHIELKDGINLEVVKLPEGPYFGKYEVTQSQWEAVMGDNPSQCKGKNNPVENVSLIDCQKFLGKLNVLPTIMKTGLKFRLPTEKEWEYACRAGATGDFCRLADESEITTETFGQVAWISDNSLNKPHPVGQKTPNAFGLYDMYGNVEELTSSGMVGGVFTCGGEWNTFAEQCKSSTRGFYMPSDRNGHLGVRLCAESFFQEKDDGAIGKTFDGLFGVKFGTVVDISRPGKENDVGALAYNWEPDSRFRDFPDYVVFATPMTRQVFLLRAIRDIDPEDAAGEVATIMKQMEKQFGKEAFMADDMTGGLIVFDNNDHIAVGIAETVFGTKIFVDARCARLAELVSEEVVQKKSAPIREIIDSLVDIP